MINGRFTAAEAADLLGVKPATLYAYVSRGLLERQKDGKASTFDPRDVARLSRSGRTRSDAPRSKGPSGFRTTIPAETQPSEPLFVTQLTLIQDGRFYFRGLDAVELSRQRTFEEVASWLWNGQWPQPPADGERVEPWLTPPAARAAVEAALRGAHEGARPLERFAIAVVVAALSDDFRHDLSPAAVPVIGRGLIALLSETLDARGREGRSRDSSPAERRSIAGRTWECLSDLPPTGSRVSLLDAALVLSADHELAPSTMAARVAASFRADAYAVVSTGLGPASGSWAAGSTGAPSEVEAMLEDCLEVGPERAVGERLRRTGSVPHGFGMPLYPDGDPRGAELLSRLGEVGGPAEKHEVVDRVLAIASERGFPPPNVDLGLGALSFCAGMPPESGQAIATLAKIAGWLAHALEEYADPSRFRSRAYYVGPRPA
ncbi:MAG TPA: citrate synthase [Acidimicrobiales bacterium]